MPSSRTLRSESRFEFLVRIHPRAAAAILADETAGDIAVVLAHLESRPAGAILGALDEAAGAAAALALLRLGPIAPSSVDPIEKRLRRKLSMDAEGGMVAVVAMLDATPPEARNRLVRALRALDPEHLAIHEDGAETVDLFRRRFFVFDDIAHLDRRSMQTVIRRVSHHDLALALHGATDEARRWVFENMSERAAETLREDIETEHPAWHVRVEESQERILDVIRELEESELINVCLGDCPDAGR